MILARSEGRAVEGQRNMAVIGPRTEVGGAPPAANVFHLIATEYEHDVPVAVVGVAVRQFATPLGLGQLPVCQFEAGVDSGYLRGGREAMLHRIRFACLWSLTGDRRWQECGHCVFGCLL